MSADSSPFPSLPPDVSLLPAIAAAVGSGIAAVDVTGRNVYVNDALCRMLGWSRDELVGLLPPFPYWPDEEKDRIYDVLRKSLGGKVPAGGIELVFRRRTGERFPVLLFVALLAENGVATGAVANIVDLTEQRAATEALRTSERMFRDLTEHIEEVFYVFDPVCGRMTYVSPSYEQVWGRSRDSLYERPLSFLEAVVPDHRARTAANLQAQALGKITRDEYRIVRPDGSEAWVFDQSFPLRDEGGIVSRVVGTATDITSRKKAEQRLEESERRLAFALEASQVGFWDWNIATNGLVNDEAWAANLGYRLAEVPPTYDFWRDNQHPEDRERVEATLQAHLDGFTPLFRAEFRMRAKDGHWVWLEARGRVVERAGDGRALRVVGTAQDVSDRVEAQSLVRRAHRALRTVTECKAAAIGAASEVELMPEICRLITEVGGYRMAWVGRAESDAGQSVRPMGVAGYDDGYVEQADISWADNVRGHGPTGIAIRERRPVWTNFTESDPRTLPWREQARERGYVSGLALPVLIGDDECFGALCVYSSEVDAFDLDEVRLLQEIARDLGHAVKGLRDAAERERLAITLRQAEKMELVGQLTGGLAHDFNNLLAIVIANLDRIPDLAAAGRPVRGPVEGALEAALRGVQITRSLLTLARKRPLDVAVNDVNARVRNLEPLLRHTLKPKIALAVQLAAEDLHALIDVGALDTALLNLVVNSRDAMPDGGEVVLSTRRVAIGDGAGSEPVKLPAGTYVAVEVRDDGVGMDAATLARITEPFFTTKPERLGSGLGMGMVDHFCRTAGGRMAVESAPGKGTVVAMYLPWRAAAVDVEAPQTVPAPTPPGSRYGRILAVDDEAGLLLLASAVLEGEGHTVTAVETAEEALAELGRSPYDVLFADVMLSGKMDGLTLARWAKEHVPGMQIVLTSGVPLAPEVTAGLCAFVEKPFRIAYLAEVIATALAARGAAPGNA